MLQYPLWELMTGHFIALYCTDVPVIHIVVKCINATHVVRDDLGAEINKFLVQTFEIIEYGWLHHIAGAVGHIAGWVGHFFVKCSDAALFINFNDATGMGRGRFESHHGYFTTGRPVLMAIHECFYVKYGEIISMDK
jgi:hypothetical protein